MYFRESIYHYEFHVFYRDDPKLEKFKKKHKIKLEDSGLAETSLHDNTYILITFDPKFRKKAQWYKVEVIAHEAWHATELALFNSGCGINLSTVNEHLAYYTGFVAGRLAHYLL